MSQAIRKIALVEPPSTLTEEPMPDSSNLDQVSSPLPAPPRRKRRVLALVLALGLGLAGGLNLHRFVDLDETGTLLLHGLQSSYRWARKEVGTRIASLTKQPVTVAQVNTSAETQTADLVDRMINDLSGRADQIRAANETTAQGLNEGFERLRITADQSQREVVANLARLNERLDRIERQSAAGTVPMVTPAPTQPIVQSSAPPPANARSNPSSSLRLTQRPSRTRSRRQRALKSPGWTPEELRPGRFAKLESPGSVERPPGIVGS